MGPTVGVGHPHIFGLAAVVAAGGVRVAEDAAHGRGLGVGFVAVAEQALLAEQALAAGNVERHQHMVAHFKLGYLGADFLDHRR